VGRRNKYQPKVRLPCGWGVQTRHGPCVGVMLNCVIPLLHTGRVWLLVAVLRGSLLLVIIRVRLSGCLYISHLLATTLVGRPHILPLSCPFSTWTLISRTAKWLPVIQKYRLYRQSLSRFLRKNFLHRMLFRDIY